MAKKHDQSAESPADDTPPPTAFEKAMAEIAAEAEKLIHGGMGGHDAYELAYNVWLHTVQMG